MTLVGIVVFFVLLALAKGAKHLRVGPHWLRRFTADKGTLY